jgi:hypothetical protein
MMTRIAMARERGEALIDGSAERLAAERRHWSHMAIIIVAIIFAGFAPSFYLRGIIPHIRPLHSINPLVMIHGLVFSSWLVLLITQTQLMAHGRRDLHMKLGILGFCIASTLPVLGFLVALGQVPKGTQPPFATPEQWQAIALIDAPVLATLIYLGWRNRRNAQVHKRIMIYMSMRLTEPALGRLVVFPFGPGANYTASVLSMLLFIPAIRWDLKTQGRVHWVTKFCVILFTCEMLFRYAVWKTESWAMLVRWLVKVFAPIV